MNRREAVQRVALMMGGVLAAPLMAGVMGQVTNTGASVAVTAEQEALLAEVADIIIPTTDTPGAKAAGVEKFIVRVMRDCYKKEDQDKFYAGLAKLDADSQTKFGKGFIALDTAQKNEMVKLSTTEDTSEIGATKALEYLPIPGKFEGCIPLKAGQKAWAL
ncbi:MAG: gluconate 2-dehydrogenase subunit 3 family protein [Arcicella sp.]|nr:gluconate 2-dehydrogenase subunit 3 family protein [Arcicella sp.]